jgi:hypothetical protein
MPALAAAEAERFDPTLGRSLYHNLVLRFFRLGGIHNLLTFVVKLLRC